jgi:hypothetical protein
LLSLPLTLPLGGQKLPFYLLLAVLHLLLEALLLPFPPSADFPLLLFPSSADSPLLLLPSSLNLPFTLPHRKLRVDPLLRAASITSSAVFQRNRHGIFLISRIVDPFDKHQVLELRNDVDRIMSQIFGETVR